MVPSIDYKEQMRMHYRILKHEGFGVTELRVISPRPMVAYADNEENFARLCLALDGKVPGIYVGVQPRPVQLFDLAPNIWTPAIGGIDSNCGKDEIIEILSTIFFDIDVDSPGKNSGHPASETELQNTLRAAELIAALPEFEGNAVIGCSGNGH